MKRLFCKIVLLSIIASQFIFSNAYASSYQIFGDLMFDNPATLNRVKKGQMIIGGAVVNPRIRFVGTASGVSGSASSRVLDLIPYGRLAVRLTPKLVIGVDITQPYYTDVQYPRDSIVKSFSTETIIRDTNFSLRGSYQVTKQLALGLGLDANNLYNGQLNFNLAPLGLITNKADGWAYGWDAGLFYTITRSTFLSLSYFSRIIQHLNGVSQWGPLTNKSLSAHLPLPATTILNITQMLSPYWALSGTLRYTQWNTLRYVNLQNTAAGNILIPSFFFSNVSAELGTRYQLNQKLALFGSFNYEPNVQPTWTRNPGLPTYTRYRPAIGGEYTLTKGLKAKMIYGHTFSKPPIDITSATGAVAKGRIHLNTDIYVLSIIYDV